MDIDSNCSNNFYHYITNVADYCWWVSNILAKVEYAYSAFNKQYQPPISLGTFYGWCIDGITFIRISKWKVNSRRFFRTIIFLSWRISWIEIVKCANGYAIMLTKCDVSYSSFIDTHPAWCFHFHSIWCWSNNYLFYTKVN